MKKVKGRALELGSKIGVVAPASPLHSVEEITSATSKLVDCGYSVVLGTTASPMEGHLAGTDGIRQQDLEKLWLDETISAIWCLRGGYGTIRLLPHLWYSLFAKKPKIFIGFSDITALEMALWSQAGLVTFHGPVLAGLENDFALNHALEQLQGTSVGEELEWPPEGGQNYIPIRSGKARGILLGGNLTTLASLIGTRFLPNLEGVILFLEETLEQAYRIDRMLTQLMLCGILPAVAGVVVGQCVASSDQNHHDLVKVFKERLSALQCPVGYGFPIGHIAQQWTLPQGAMAEVDIDCGSLVLLENPVE